MDRHTNLEPAGLTPTELVLRDKIANARELLDRTQVNLGSLLVACTHRVVRSAQDGMAARCLVCGAGFSELGWYCPDSPTHLCCYEQALPDGPVQVNEDSCIYCGQPEERK